MEKERKKKKTTKKVIIDCVIGTESRFV